MGLIASDIGQGGPILYGFGPGVIEWRGGCVVRLEDKFRNCSAIIGSGKVGTKDEIEPWGSGFLVECDTSIPDAKYLVTNWHVIAGKTDAPFDVRFNKRSGGAENYYIDEPNWITHPTDITVDVAVHRIDVPDWADCCFVERNPFILDTRRLESKDIGAGNRTYTVGLWKFLRGDRRNQPFVYSGHIGLVPDDQKVAIESWLPDHDKNYVLVDAYLVEGEPLDGASGSPVFVRRSIKYKIPDTKLKGFIEGSVWLLGIQSNAWFGEPGKDYEIPVGRDRVVVPRGVNAVVPSMKISEVLDHPDLIEAREKSKRAETAKMLPMKTGAKSEPPTTEDNPLHREDFRHLVSEAAKKRSRDDQT